MNKPARLAAASSLALLTLALPGLGKPGWSGNPDTATEQGHTFICEGQGKTEEDALGAAHGICNDKICKVCGVEVTSTVETKETLTGVDFQRKVVERCRRVRKQDAQVKRKSTDCDEGTCSAWLEIWYPKELEKQECASYTKEDFADPAACEKDLDGFRNVEGRDAASFRARTGFLDAALIHCAQIDVRPTPAMLALDEKLKAGLDAFEFTDRFQDRWAEQNRVSDPFSYGASDSRSASLQSRPFWAWYLTSDPALRRQIAENKTLLGRFRLARDWVASRALVFDVIEAVRSKDWDTPAGIARLAAAMEKAPVGTSYGQKNVHVSAVASFYRAKSDTAAVGAIFRKLYPPESVGPGDSWPVSLFFADDKKVTPEEWDYVFAMHEKSTCAPCLRVLLAAKDHGPDPELRYRRFLTAYQSVVTRFKGKLPEVRAVTELAGYNEPGLLVAMEARLPEAARAAYTYKYLGEVVSRIYPEKTDPADAAALLSRAVKQLAAEAMDERGACSQLASQLEHLVGKKADVGPLDGAVCACLKGSLRNEVHLVNRDDLLKHAEKRGLACTKGLPKSPQ